MDQNETSSYVLFMSSMIFLKTNYITSNKCLCKPSKIDLEFLTFNYKNCATEDNEKMKFGLSGGFRYGVPSSIEQ